MNISYGEFILVCPRKMGPAVQMQWVPVPTTLLSIFTSSGTDTSLHYSNPMGGHSWIIKCCSHVLGASPGSVHHSHNVIYLSEPWRGHFCVSRGVEEKKCILIYGGHCFGVGGWECAMAFPSFFFFCTAVGQNCFQGRMIVLLVYIVNQTDDPCIFQLDGSNGQPKKYIQCTWQWV